MINPMLNFQVLKITIYYDGKLKIYPDTVMEVFSDPRPR